MATTASGSGSTTSPPPSPQPTPAPVPSQVPLPTAPVLSWFQALEILGGWTFIGLQHVWSGQTVYIYRNDRFSLTYGTGEMISKDLNANPSPLQGSKFLGLYVVPRPFGGATTAG